MNRPLVSVVLCTYNDEKYIGETIASVLAQSYDNFEFIIWNDGSTDSTEDVIKSYHDERIRYFNHENTGIGMARAMATAQAKGEYIAPVDGDDVYMLTRVEEGVKFLNEHQDYVMVCTQCEQIDEGGKYIGETFSCTTDFIIRNKFPHDLVTHSSSLFRKAAYIACGGYAGVRAGLDHLLFMRMAKVGKMKMLNKPLVKYRFRGNSISHIYNPYMSTLFTFRVKMAQDTEVLQDDVELYNDICKLSKKIAKTHQNITQNTGSYKRGQSLEQQLYNITRFFVGRKTARNFVVFIKNTLFYIKYKCAWGKK